MGDLWLPNGGGVDDAIWDKVRFTHTSEEPLFSQLGDPETKQSREEALACMDIVPMLGFWNIVPPLSSSRPWNLIEHQAAGMRCNQLRLIGTTVLLKAEIHAACLDVARDWFAAGLGEHDLQLEDVIAYRRQINAIGLDCNEFLTFTQLQEGFYPAEIDQATADRFFEEKIVLADLFAEPAEWIAERWLRFFFIAGNSD
jgi:hypothetical protein